MTDNLTSQRRNLRWSEDPDYGLHVWLNRFERFSLGECLNRAMEGDVEASHELVRYLSVALHLGVVPEKRAGVYFAERLANLVKEREQFRDGSRSKDGNADRALGLKGPQSGGRPKSNQSAHDDKLGRAVARKRGQGYMLQEALDDVSVKYKVSPRTVGRAYNNFKPKMVFEVLSAMTNDTRADLLQSDDLSDDEYRHLLAACADQAIEVVARENKTKPKVVRKAWDDWVTESEKFKTEEQ